MPIPEMKGYASPNDLADETRKVGLVPEDDHLLGPTTRILRLILSPIGGHRGDRRFAPPREDMFTGDDTYLRRG
jgi:hypothetical protein